MTSLAIIVPRGCTTKAKVPTKETYAWHVYFSPHFQVRSFSVIVSLVLLFLYG